MLDLDQCLGYRVHPLTSRHYDDIADAGLEQNREIIHYSTKENSRFKGNEGNTKLEERASSSGEELAQKKWRQEEEEWESG
uniref:Uncharacterized protein n=1 Tax=Cucumis melo TaxID=3656 RepID=A0A9I9D0F1_CUCME